MKLRILIAGLVFGVTAFAAETGAELFQKAVTQERAAGNLEEAIKLYQRVAKEFASDRALAAKALVQEARCYEKLGQDKAVKLYEQVARDFGDQREPAAAASARLAVLRQGDRAAAVPATMTQRKIELPSPSSFPLFTTDGQRFVYKDDATGALMISDLTGRDTRVIFKPKAGVVVSPLPIPSRDLAVVFMGLTRPDGSHIGAVIKTDGTGYREIGGGGEEGCLPDWSWDNRYILLCQRQPDRPAQLVRLSVADGEIHKIREADGSLYRFSPDGRFIAYSNGFTRSPSGSGQIFVVPSQGGEPRLVSGSARLLDWTRDGRYLAIAMDRSGSEALCLLPINDGGQAGDPVFVRYGAFDGGRTTAGGALVYSATPRGGQFASWLGALDSDSRLGGWKRLSLSGSNQGPSFAAWSPDSRQIAYAAANHAAGQNTSVVRLRNIASGEERELYQGGAGLMYCLWAAQHPNLFCGQHTPQNTTELLSISIDSGRAERLGSVPGLGYVLFTSRDDRAIYMTRVPREVIRWEISTQQATTMDGIVSPDERWIARSSKGKVEIRPMSGGDWKPLISLGERSESAFTPDGNWFLYHDVNSAGKQSLFRVAAAGGQPERLGDFPSTRDGGLLRISPDGQQIIANVFDPASAEVWMLENFEPKQQAAR